jgi:hypothetical protein
MNEDTNKIGYKGVELFSQINWTNLKEIHLCNVSITKGIAIWARRGSKI